MKKEICNFILKNSELLEGVEEDNNIIIYALDLDRYDEETDSFYRVVDYKGIKKVAQYLVEKCETFYPQGYSTMVFDFEDFKVFLPNCTARDIF